jgi:hypothetical protein
MTHFDKRRRGFAAPQRDIRRVFRPLQFSGLMAESSESN